MRNSRLPQSKKEGKLHTKVKEKNHSPLKTHKEFLDLKKLNITDEKE